MNLPGSLTVVTSEEHEATTRTFTCKVDHGFWPFFAEITNG